MVNSMTGFAAATGGQGPYRWAWELRSVNAKGLDLRLRVPDWIGGLEQGARAELARRIKRGNISLNLRLTREAGDAPFQVDSDMLHAILAALKQVERAAKEQNLPLRPASAAEVMGMRGVLQTGPADEDTGPLLKALLGELPALIDAFDEMRAGEGASLAAVLHDQLGAIEALIADAMREADARQGQMAVSLRSNLARVMDHSEGADEARVAQELALIAVKADIREELDRLEAHVLAARDLLRAEGPIGRKLDFLMQEFNREANTLCSKSQSTALTRIGLDLKATIDQMREQVQNVE
ncbi:MAG: YicC family protein [Confluentimicrobium sp.]|uniref:YicC/YloC family endoribonuclease n=1 Tax=Actibacterium sp. TaxID=1872125 RepID=UPI000C4CD81E|nr:YicC/YloC family endoribonuclease [Actibacterium sp.]MBC57688.1 YicC family protein [Actibacterium sp.]